MARLPLEERVKPGRTAVVVIDVQNDFVHPDGANSKWMRARYEAEGIRFDPLASPMIAITEQIKRLVEIARKRSIPVIWTREVLTDATDARFWKAEGSHLCRAGSWGAEWYNGLGPAEGELEVLKNRHSCFHATNLDLALRHMGIEGLVLAGTATHGCVEGSARDAMAHDYWAVVPSDCCGQIDMVAHEAALSRIDKLFGMVTTLDELDRIWSASNGRND